MILVDPLDARLHRIAAPIYRKALSGRATLNAKLLQRDKDLEAAGFAPQVKVTPETTLMFQIRDGVRQPIVYQGEHGGQTGTFKFGDSVLAEAEVLQLADSSPETLSPNALLRPVVQDYLFPTVAFCISSAEISYLAQSEVIYREILGRMPVLLPRADFASSTPRPTSCCRNTSCASRISGAARRNCVSKWSLCRCRASLPRTSTRKRL